MVKMTPREEELKLDYFTFLIKISDSFFHKKYDIAE